MTDAEEPTTPPEEAPAAEPGQSQPATSASREAILERISISLLNAGIVMPAVEFVAAVRATAGYRVNPREIDIAIAHLQNAGMDIDAAAVAELAGATRGDRSQRQQRHADEWRALGATMTLKGMDGSPAAQRELIGAARVGIGPRATDILLLRIANALGALNAPFDAATIGGIARRLAHSAPDLTPDDITALVRRELGAMRRAQRPRAKRPSSVGARRTGSHKTRPGRRGGGGLKRTLRNRRK